MRSVTLKFLLLSLVSQFALINRGLAYDADNDGMSDVWQRVHSIATGDTSSDPDFDGYTNAQEALAGTDPKNGADYPRITDITRIYNNATSNYTTTISWRSAEGVFYLIEESTDLINWTALVQINGGSGVTTGYSLTTSFQFRKFYRVTASASSILNSDADLLLNWEEQLLGTNSHSTDSDNDGIPDDWEFIHHLEPTIDDATGDPDGDGLDNLGEYQNGSDPNVTDYVAAPQSKRGYKWLGHSAEFTFYTLNEGRVDLGTYWLDNFLYNQNADTQDEHHFYQEFKTEIFGLASKFCDDETILVPAMNSYAEAFKTPQLSSIITRQRWNAGDSGVGATTTWRQAEYPDNAENPVLTDAAKDSALRFLSVELKSPALLPQNVTQSFLLVDYTLNEDGSIATSIPPEISTGSVTFAIDISRKFPKTCQIAGDLPAGVVTEIAVPASGISASPTVAVQFWLAPPRPNVRRQLIPLEVKAVESGGNTAPENGLIVKKGDSIEFSCTSMDQASFPIPQQNITWYYAVRKMNGDWRPWAPFGATGKGVKFEAAMDVAAVYRVKVIMNGTELELLRKTEEKANGNTYGFGSIGSYDCFGVAEDQLMMNFVEEAQGFLGSTYYAGTNVVPEQYGWPQFGLLGNQVIRCNLFIAHRASAVNVIVPHINGLTLAYPPVANQWAGVEDSDDNSTTFDETIEHWSLFRDQDQELMKPGMIIAHPVIGDAGHCGIVDYDGEAIAAGISGTVNKLYTHFFDGTSGYREYEP